MASPHPAIERVLYSAEQIAAKTAELAARINADYQGQPLVLLGVLKGSFIFLADLCRLITVPHRIEMMAVSVGVNARSTCLPAHGHSHTRAPRRRAR